MIDKVIFIGSKSLGYHVLKTMYELNPKILDACITMDDIMDSRSCLKDIKEYCAAHDICYFEMIGSCDISEIILERKPDICFVVGWYKIIPSRILNSVQKGFLGIHNSLLPAYRGQAPLVWAMIQGEKKVGFSLFSFTEEMDEGDIWAQEAVIIDENVYISDVLQVFEERAVGLFKRIYLKIIEGSIHPLCQTGQISYCGKRDKDSGLIDWKKNARDVLLEIHAQSKPYPGAYTIWNDERLIIWKARKFEYKFIGIPGRVGLIMHGDIIVACGESTAIVLEDVEYGKYRGNPNKIIKSLNTKFL